MKSITLSYVAPLLLLAACQSPSETPKTQNIFLTPEIMCGTVQFTDGCGAEMDTLIRFGIALIHHMTYEDAAYTFDQVIRKDPDCFWGHWGKAMTYIHPLWPDVPSEKEMENGWVLANRALSLAKKEKEKLYGAALAAYYVKEQKTKQERLAALQQGWAAAAAALPDDPEAALFNGLFRLSIVSPADKTFAVQQEVGEMAERYLAMYPDHPGAYHYGIHAYDVPPLADKALQLARTYGKIAPEIPHALHMPSHIFTRLGYWKESAEWNARSARAAARYPYQGEISPHMFHALDYQVYALLQMGDDAAAKAIVANMDTLKAPFHVAATTAYGIAAMPARLALETQKWDEAAALASPDTSQFPWQKFPQWEGLIHFGKGLGAARSGKADLAETCIARISELQTQLGNSPPTKYWYDQMEAQKLAIRGWNEFMSGRQPEGLALLQQAADLEDATSKNPVSPGELLPARELLGDMLMAMKQPAEALVAYEACLKTRPNRFNSLYGAGEAAEKSGQPAKAKEYYQLLLATADRPGTTRERISAAKRAVTEG